MAAARHRKKAHGGGINATGTDNKNAAPGRAPVSDLGRTLGTKVDQSNGRFSTNPMSVEGSSAIPALGRRRAHGGKLSHQERKHLKSSSFVFPGERRYPIEDKNHARNALARVSQHGSSSEKAKVRAEVHRKYPDIGSK